MKKTHILFLLLWLFSAAGFSQKTEIQYLSGKDKDHTIDWEFFCTDGRNSGKWTTIPVPSHWEQHGFGEYNYGSDLYNQHKKPVADEQGLYKYRFSIPKDWKNKSVEIVFEGSMTDTEVKINGKSAGEVHQGAFYRFSYEISDLLNFSKENLLEVKVSKLSANQSVTLAERRGDYWVFGGIYRPVYLRAKPQEHIERTAIDARANGDFHIHVFLENIKKADKVEAQITTLTGEKVGTAFAEGVKKGQKKVVLKTHIENPKLWSPEFPNLYFVELALKNRNKNLHTEHDRFGFRTVEVRRHEGIFINGEKIMFRGVNRHSFYPESGRCLSKELSIQDVNLMKDMNMNAVRMSHYPPDVHFLDVCDSLGLFVLDELAGWQKPYYDTEVGKKLVEEMVTRDVNHPSIVIWNNGNEGGSNPELDKEFAKYDPQNRQVIHPWKIHNGMDTQHYKPYYYGANSHFNGTDIFFATEVLHGLYDGGHGAGLDDYWSLMLRKDLSAGAFLWVFSDEGIVRTDQNGRIDTDKNHAPDGIVGPYREKEASFYTIKEIWSPVYIEKQHITPRFDGRLLVENRFHYTNLNQCSFEWQLAALPSPKAGMQELKPPQNGSLQAPDVAPQMRGYLKLNLPKNWHQYDILYLKATDPHKREIFTWSWPLKMPNQVAETLLEKGKNTVKTSEKDGFLVAEAEKTTLKFNQNNGMLEHVLVGGEPISFRHGPVLGNGKLKFKTLSHKTENNTLIVETTYEGDDMMEVKWTIYPSGWVALDYDFRQVGKFPYIGINFDYPEENVTAMRWMGRGPFRVWKNRLKGQQFGVWHKDYNNSVTGETWEYPEFKGYHSEFYWAVVETKEKPFLIVNRTPGLFLRMLTPKEPEGAYNDNTAPPFPDGDISVLHGISPIGTKFKNPEQLGGQSQPNEYVANKPNWRLHGSLLFKFDWQ